MGLTGKQKAFVDHYIISMNATKAALLAGYSEKTAYSIGHENLNKPEIAEEINKRFQSRAMQADEALLRLGEMARSDLSEFIGMSEEDIKNHPKGWLLHTYKRDDKGQVEIKLYDAQSALFQIIKNLRLDDGQPTERFEHDIEKMTDDDLASLIRKS